MTTANQLIAVNSDVLTSDSVFDMMVSKIGDYILDIPNRID